MSTDVAGPDGSALSEGLGPLLDEWALAAGDVFVDYPLGPRTAGTVSRSDLLQLMAATQAAERERCARWLEWYDGAETRRSEAIRNGDHWAPDTLLI